MNNCGSGTQSTAIKSATRYVQSFTFTGIPYYSATLFISDLVRMPSKPVSKAKRYAPRVIAHVSTTELLLQLGHSIQKKIV